MRQRNPKRKTCDEDHLDTSSSTTPTDDGKRLKVHEPPPTWATKTASELRATLLFQKRDEFFQRVVKESETVYVTITNTQLLDEIRLLEARMYSTPQSSFLADNLWRDRAQHLYQSLKAINPRNVDKWAVASKTFERAHEYTMRRMCKWASSRRYTTAKDSSIVGHTLTSQPANRVTITPDNVRKYVPFYQMCSLPPDDEKLFFPHTWVQIMDHERHLESLPFLELLIFARVWWIYARVIDECLPRLYSERTYLYQLERLLSESPIPLPTIICTYTKTVESSSQYRDFVHSSLALTIADAFSGAHAWQRFHLDTALVDESVDAGTRSFVMVQKTHTCLLPYSSSSSSSTSTPSPCKEPSKCIHYEVSHIGMPVWSHSGGVTSSSVITRRPDIPTCAHDVIPLVAIWRRTGCHRFLHANPIWSMYAPQPAGIRVGIEAAGVLWSYGLDVPRAIRLHFAFLETISSVLMDQYNILPELSAIIVNYMTVTLDAHQLDMALHHGPHE